jgi:hypothetical protein
MPFATVSSNCFIKKKKKSLPTRTKPNTPLRVAVVEGEGCSFRCVIETVAALNGRRFLLEPLDIARLSRDKSCLDDIDILVMPGGDDDENLAAGWGRGQRAALGSPSTLQPCISEAFNSAALQPCISSSLQLCSPSTPSTLKACSPSTLQPCSP